MEYWLAGPSGPRETKRPADEEQHSDSQSTSKKLHREQRKFTVPQRRISGSASKPVEMASAASVASQSSHEGNKHYACHDCGLAFSRLGNLVRHVQTQCLGSRLVCEICQKSFKSYYSLQQHITDLNHEPPRKLRSTSSTSPGAGKASHACRSCTFARVRCDGEKPCRRCVSRKLSCVSIETPSNAAMHWMHISAAADANPQSEVTGSFKPPMRPEPLETEVASSVGTGFDSGYGSAVSHHSVHEQFADFLLFEAGAFYHELVNKSSLDSFEQEHDVLLQQYFDGLRKSTDNELLLWPIELLSMPSARKLVGKLLVQKAADDAGMPHIALHILRDTLGERPKEAKSHQMHQPGGYQSIYGVDGPDPSAHWHGSLDVVAEFLTAGEAFANLCAGLRYLAISPSSIGDCLDAKDVQLLTIFLEKHFDEAAVGDYQWIAQLRDIGYSGAEMAALIYERTFDSPWIYFEPRAKELSFKVSPGTHLKGCTHEMLMARPEAKPTMLPQMSHEEEREIKRMIEELCGLGGVAPYSRDLDEWDGHASFSNDKSEVQVSHRASQDSANGDEFSSTNHQINVAEKLATASGLVQNVGLCCDCFTILTLQPSSSSSADAPSSPSQADQLEVQLHRVSFHYADKFAKLLKVTKELKDNGLYTSHALAMLEETAREVVGLVTVKDNGPAKSLSSALEILHISSLALQILCVGFLSYTQAHVGPLQPFFLDKPAERVALQGIGDASSPAPIIAGLVHLRCLSGVTQGPVLAFDASTLEGGSSLLLDVRARLDDVLDTWGPGKLICQKGGEPVAVEVGGGYITAPSSEVGRYHWDTELGAVSQSSQPLSLSERVLIGGLVVVNHSCRNEEQACWEAASGQFEELGTYQPFLEVSEYQVGMQGGLENFAITANKVWGKRRGKTVKARNLERDDELLIPFLNFYWGLRVSYCTGVAQRVTLAQMVADLLPAFAAALTSQQAREWWSELEVHHGILEHFRNTRPRHLMEWLRGLPDKLHDFVLRLVRQILTTLQDTGLSPNGLHFLVAWPHEGIVNRGFRIPLDSDPGNKWAAMLADSDDCATFAYIHNICLEASGIACRGPNPEWHGRLSLLETAVLCPASRMTSWSLASEQVYFFHKLDNNLFWVKARRRTIACEDIAEGKGRQDKAASGAVVVAPVYLVRLESLQSLPRDLMHRLLFKEEQKQQRRLREKDLATVRAETVSVLSQTF